MKRLVGGEQPGEGWLRALAEPSEFLSLDLCAVGWLQHAGPCCAQPLRHRPLLCAAAAALPLTGRALLRCDRCFPGRATLLVDRNLAYVPMA
jgi:hypothetical protein